MNETGEGGGGEEHQGILPGLADFILTPFRSRRSMRTSEQRAADKAAIAQNRAEAQARTTQYRSSESGRDRSVPE